MIPFNPNKKPLNAPFQHASKGHTHKQASQCGRLAMRAQAVSGVQVAVHSMQDRLQLHGGFQKARGSVSLTQPCSMAKGR